MTDFFNNLLDDGQGSVQSVQKSETVDKTGENVTENTGNILENMLISANAAIVGGLGATTGNLTSR